MGSLGIAIDDKKIFDLLKTLQLGMIPLNQTQSPLSYNRSLLMFIGEVNPKDLQCTYFWERSPSKPIDISYDHSDASPLDFDLYDASDNSEAVKVTVVLSDPAADFPDGPRAILAGDIVSYKYFANLTLGTVAGRPAASFYVLRDPDKKGRLRGFNIFTRVRGSDYSTLIIYDPKIKNNGEICGDNDPDPVCD